METLPFFAVASLAICMVIPTALSIKCYMCSSPPQFLRGSSCNSENVTKTTWQCPAIFDGCVTLKAMISTGVGAPQSTELRNCTVHSQLCNPQSPVNHCKLFNRSGVVLKCTFDCCQSDLCNTGISTSIPAASAVSPTPSVFHNTTSVVQSTTLKPTSLVLGLAPSFFVIFSALMLSEIVEIN